MLLQPLTLWFTGLSGAGKSTLAEHVQHALAAHAPCVMLDGDVFRNTLSTDLGFSPADRAENVRRAAVLSRMLNDQGLWVCAAFISPLAAHRAEAARLIGDARFREVYLSANLATCEGRDTKGLYRQARSGTLRGLTGLGSDYEVPQSPWLIIDTTAEGAAQSCARVMAHLEREARVDSRS